MGPRRSLKPFSNFGISKEFAPAPPDFSVSWAADARGVEVTFHYKSDHNLLIPQPKGKSQFRDGLWQETCFEVFWTLGTEGAYCEWNGSLCGDWALYEFSSYRKGMRPRPLPELSPRLKLEPSSLKLSIILPMGGENIKWAPSAVLKTRSGSLSYWALEHPQAKPDFHNQDYWQPLGL